MEVADPHTQSDQRPHTAPLSDEEEEELMHRKLESWSVKALPPSHPPTYLQQPINLNQPTHPPGPSNTPSSFPPDWKTNGSTSRHASRNSEYVPPTHPPTHQSNTTPHLSTPHLF